MFPDRFFRKTKNQETDNKKVIQEFDMTVETSFALTALLQRCKQEEKSLSCKKPENCALAMTAMLMESPMAYSLLQEAAECNWHILFNEEWEDGYHLRVEEKILELGVKGLNFRQLVVQDYTFNALLMDYIQALRDVWHQERWGHYEENYAPQAYLMMERARSADIEVIAHFIAWELRSCGYVSFWRDILGGVEGDMASLLIDLAEQFPISLHRNKALAFLFRHWYKDTQRINRTDYGILEQMDVTLRETSSRFGEKSMQAGDYEFLSLLPDGSRYLKSLAPLMAIDTFFNTVSDIINQAHLFQIVYDNKVTYAAGIPFRDSVLARRFQTIH